MLENFRFCPMIRPARTFLSDKKIAARLSGDLDWANYFAQTVVFTMSISGWQPLMLSVPIVKV